VDDKSSVDLDEEPTRGSPADVDDEPTRGLAHTAWGRAVLSVFLVLTLASVISSVMPESTLQNDLNGVALPYLVATGLDQRWGVFAPNPRQNTAFVSARVEQADGTVTVYLTPGGKGLSEYWDYRWLKYGERMWTLRTASDERATYARWIVDQDRAAGGHPVRVVLLRHTRESEPPGPGPDYSPWTDVTFYSSPVSS
jgi:hypothetical protein